MSEVKGELGSKIKKSKGLTRMTSSLSVTWVVNNTTPDLDLDKSRGV
jgi:hypothetical protein